MPGRSWSPTSPSGRSVGADTAPVERGPDAEEPPPQRGLLEELDVLTFVRQLVVVPLSQTRNSWPDAPF